MELFVHQGVDLTNYRLEVRGYCRNVLSMRMDRKMLQMPMGTTGKTWIPVGP